MRPRTTLSLLFAVCVLGCLIWFVERRLPAPGEKERRLFPFSSSCIRSLSMDQGEFRLDCSRLSGRWQITYPLRVKADEAAMARVLSVLEMLPREEVITDRQRKRRSLTLRDFGLNPPRARLILTVSGERRELAVGCDSPVGESVYVMAKGSDEVIATSRALLEIIPRTVESLRDRTLLDGDVSRIARLEVQRPGAYFLQLTRSGTGWLFQQPHPGRADAGKVSELLHALYGLKIERFVWDPPIYSVPGEPPEEVRREAALKTGQFRLSRGEAVVRVSVWETGEGVKRELLLGDRTEENGAEMYAKLGDADPICSVRTNIMAVIPRTDHDLRDKNLFSLAPHEAVYACLQQGDDKIVLVKDAARGWRMTEPANWKADDSAVETAVSVLAGLKAESIAECAVTNLSSLGLDPPACIVELGREAPGDARAAQGPERVLFSTWTGDSKKVRAVVRGIPAAAPPREGETELVFELPSAPLAGLDPGNALSYRDLTVLSVPPESVKRLVLAAQGLEQIVAKDASGEWVAVAPATNMVDKGAVANILARTAWLRALRAECSNPRSVASYGLDPPQLKLTLGLSGQEGIQKSLLLGFRAKTDGIYAMVQGDDAVFVLDKAAAQSLVIPLSKPPSIPSGRP